MSAAHAQPEPSGQRSTERKPQVVVRAGKTYVCSACGTLVEIPEDVVGQLVLAVDPPTEVSHVEPSPAQETASPQTPQKNNAYESRAHLTTRTHLVAVEDPPPRSIPQKHRPPKPNRPRQPKRTSFTDQLIDGLRVPSAKELDRALAWVSFHLKVLDRQGSEIHRLKKLLKKQRVPCPPPGAPSKSDATHSTPSRACRAKQTHAQADLGVAPENGLPGANQLQERGPPDEPHLVPSPLRGEG
ncbi:hypothetical protein [Bremerella sp. P1]|uniref:hypothetical protein n=1 Tax=Bremerella sp. P1 TaxID=3026424 RepID=UPI0023683826|nr:hypothetical protein [Bremerella sp. P1]WDI45159.1 hypothetical protein PSR63_14575 [Bremerella sp. P1]